MPLIDWREEFNTGIPEVDYEHQELIGLINALHQQLLEGESGATIEDFLGEIYSRISAHFALEEKVMRAQHYDEYEDHKNDHERLLEEIRDIMDDYEDVSQFDEETFSQRLRDWFVNHFKTRDARLHRKLG